VAQHQKEYKQKILNYFMNPTFINIRTAKRAVAEATTKSTTKERLDVYRYYGFRRVHEIQRVKRYLPIVEILEKQCCLNVMSIICETENLTLFERWKNEIKN
jgi:hypothetical protein